MREGADQEVGVTLDTLEHVVMLPLQPISRVRGGWPGFGRSDARDCLEALGQSELPLLSLASSSHGDLKDYWTSPRRLRPARDAGVSENLAAFRARPSVVRGRACKSSPLQVG